MEFKPATFYVLGRCSTKGKEFAADETPQYLRSGGMPPQENFENQAFRDWIRAMFWAVMQTKSLKIANLTLNSHH